MSVILVVDDSETIRFYHGCILKSAGYQVLPAMDGADALEILFRQKVDLVLADVNMPGIDGLELTRQIRSEKSFEAIPVILATTMDEPSERERAGSSGANGFLAKPTQPATLLAEVRRLLGA